MLLYGIVVALVFSLQMDLLPDQRQRIVGGLLWLAIFFAGMLAIDRSLAAERDDGCWEGLMLYPIAPTAVYLAKLAVNVAALAVLEAILIPTFVVLADVPLGGHPWALLLVALLGNLGLAAIGTLLSALANAVRSSGSLLALLVLPLAIPVLLAAAEATRLLAEDDLGPACWRWIQLLAACAVIFITAGIVLFDVATEE
jgi:heme exporter protein B